MTPKFQTDFGYPTGNCFNAAVASVLELPELPHIDPSLPEDLWRAQWCEFFDARGLRWNSTTREPELSNWLCHPPGFAIAHVEVVPGILHAIVCEDGKPIHDVMPGSAFLHLPEAQQKTFRIVSWTYFTRLASSEHNGFADVPAADFVPAAQPCAAAGVR